MAEVTVDVWLYGTLACYGGKSRQSSYANVKKSLPDKCTLRDLLQRLGMPTMERGITFINGQLSAMPGLQPDLGHVLKDDDRVAFFDLRSMWPFQYRHGAALTEEMQKALATQKDDGIHTTYK